MSKALTVLAECVDNRSGKRFFRGDVFDPAPTAEQALRLVKAGCLPGDAIEAAQKAEADAAKKADASTRKAAAARDKVDAARHARETAEAALAGADAAKKADAEKALADARQAEQEAEDALKAMK
jgi:colicin import membrane protein